MTIPNKCPRCGADCVLGLHIFTDGMPHVVEVCQKHDYPVKPKPSKGDWKKFVGWDDLPVLINDSEMLCTVAGCTNMGAQVHHYSPTHLFGSEWPEVLGLLCIEHHLEWHRRTRTGPFDERRYKK